MQISIKGDKELIESLSGMRSSFVEMEEPLITSSKKYLNVIATNFEDEGATFGQKWKDLTDFTIQIKKHMYPGRFDSKGRPMLVETGRMKAGFRFDVNNRNSLIFNTQEYAAYHQDGYPMLGIPKRILADVDEKREQMVQDVFENWVHGLINKHKL